MHALTARGLFCALAIMAAKAGAQPAGLAAPKLAPIRQLTPVAPDLSGTIAQPVTAKRFWGEWERARRDASALPKLRRLIAPAIGLSADKQIAYVQSVISRSIAWRSDATAWGRHDYWASAAETLSRGTGDAEDRAIVKMQALRALGFPTNALYLTLGRDKVAGPQAVLVVRHGGRYYMLDDTGAPPYTPDKRPEFTPVITFGFGGSWVHRNHVAEARTGPARPGGSAAAND